MRKPLENPTPVEDLAKYERDESVDDYRHRMIVNVVAFAFIVALIGAGSGWPTPCADAQKSGLRLVGPAWLHASRSDQRALVRP